MRKPETKLQNDVVTYLKANKIYYINTHGNGWSSKGAPDVIVCLKGKFIAFELKVGSNNMQDDQIIHKMRIERSGGLHYAPYTFEEFIEIIKENS